MFILRARDVQIRHIRWPNTASQPDIYRLHSVTLLMGSALHLILITMHFCSNFHTDVMCDNALCNNAFNLTVYLNCRCKHWQRACGLVLRWLEKSLCFCFKRRVLHASNAIQTIDNEMANLIIYIVWIAFDTCKIKCLKQTLGVFQMSNFSCAELNVNEPKQRV